MIGSQGGEMADRIALCIEPDAETAAQIRKLLEPRGFEVKSIPNGDEAMEWGRANPPAIIILSVEPRKIGYAISNKLRRSPTLRDVPLVLISAEETLATFEQHKKLKSRANEYLLKPLDPEVFIEKVTALAGEGGDGDDEEIHELDADSDIVLADDDDVAIVSSEEDDDEDRTLLAGETRESREAQKQAAGDKAPHDTAAHELEAGEGTPPFEGEKFDPETQAAFAALEANSPETSSQSNDMVDLRNLWSDDDLPANLGWEQAAMADKPTQVGGPTAAADNDPDAFRTGETLGPEILGADAPGAEAPPHPEEFSDLATEAGGMVLGEAFTAPVDDRRMREAEARNSELEARIHSLESERQTLRKEIEEARERFTQSSTFSKEREFLGLREIINKKEKDILDLRDALDAKERLILDHKDKIRELDRARRDLEEASLGFERNLVVANERLSEVVQDREKSGEREKGLKARLDDAHEELRRARDEIDGLKKRVGQEEVRGRMETERTRSELEARIAEQEESHRAELARLNDEHGQAVASAEAARQTELVRIDVAHRAETEALQRRLSEEQVLAGERLSAEMNRLRKEHEKAIAAARD